MEEQKNERKEIWLDNNSYRSQLAVNSIIPLRPDIGLFMIVNDLEIPEEFFKEEYDAITKAYFGIMTKLDVHYINKQ